jgi:hypothetical protein
VGVAPYWILEHSIDHKVIGRTYPQHQEMVRGYDYDAPDSVHNVPRERLARFEPNFRTVVLAGAAKPTDLVSSAPLNFSGLLVSARFWALLGFARLPQHRPYPVPLSHRRRPVHGYRWLHLPHTGFEVPAGTPPDSIQAAIAGSRAARWDLFLGMGDKSSLIPSSGRGPVWFVSERLRQAVETLGLSGAAFREAVLPGPSYWDPERPNSPDGGRKTGRRK